MAGITDVVAKVAGDLDVTQAKAREAVDAVLDAIESITADGDSVILRGFGTFKVKTKAARAGVNPQTGAKINIPEKQVLSFKAAK